MTIHVQELKPGDGLIWRDLRLRALKDSPNAFGMTYEVESQRSDDEWREQINRNVADPLVTNLVARVDDEPAALAVCRFDENDQTICHLFAMWVAPEFRRRGVGRAVLESALDWMKQKGAKEAHLSVTEGNIEAFTLYRSLGFLDTSRREPLREGSPLQLVDMRRQLEDSLLDE